MNPKMDRIWIIFGILCGIAGTITLLPYPAADNVNFLGYHSICPMAPISSGTLYLLSGLVVYVRILIKKEMAATKEHIEAPLPHK